MKGCPVSPLLVALCSQLSAMAVWLGKLHLVVRRHTGPKTHQFVAHATKLLAVAAHALLGMPAISRQLALDVGTAVAACMGCGWRAILRHLTAHIPLYHPVDEAIVQAQLQLKASQRALQALHAVNAVGDTALCGAAALEWLRAASCMLDAYLHEEAGAESPPSACRLLPPCRWHTRCRPMLPAVLQTWQAPTRHPNETTPPSARSAGSERPVKVLKRLAWVWHQTLRAGTVQLQELGRPLYINGVEAYADQVADMLM